MTETIGNLDIPDKRIKGAESFGTWGSPDWRDLYEGDLLAWADNKIRMLNLHLRENPQVTEEVQTRDLLYRWRNAYLAEYNSAPPGRPVDERLEDGFWQVYLTALEEAYKGKSDEDKQAALSKAKGFNTRRKNELEYKRTWQGDIEEY
ncbi:hypothetical protein MUP46_03515 [Patescibacteria group bacterium]|nr:hypothetical protein [Patescibacteria group bacterium]